MADPRYPAGTFSFAEDLGAAARASMLEELAAQPAGLRAAVDGLTDAQLDTPWRDGGWTLRQIIHHAADASLNLYVRLKLALTEDSPRVAPFDQDRWSELPDARTLAPSLSVDMLQSVHRRIVAVLRPLGADGYARLMNHPERGEISVDYVAQYMAWHTRHHTEQIKTLRRQRGW